MIALSDLFDTATKSLEEVIYMVLDDVKNRDYV